MAISFAILRHDPGLHFIWTNKHRIVVRPPKGHFRIGFASKNVKQVEISFLDFILL